MLEDTYLRARVQPNADGWGYTPRYSTAWERIFAKKQGGDAGAAAKPETTGTSAEADREDPILRRLIAEISALTPAQLAKLREAVFKQY